MRKKRCIISVLVIVIGLISVFSAVKRPSKTIPQKDFPNFFDMSIEELMKLDVVVVSSKEKIISYVPSHEYWSIWHTNQSFLLNQTDIKENYC